MNTNSAMRTVLAAAAAGALVLGSAGAATAAPKSPKAKGPKVVAAADATARLSKVDIKRHSKIDLADVTATTAITLRGMVRYSTKVKASDALGSFGVTLAVYDKKVNGTMADDSASAPATLSLKPRTKARKNQLYAGSAVITEVWTGEQIAALAGAVKAKGKAYICISSVDTDFDTYSMQTRKRLDKGVKRTVRECVKVVGELPAPPSGT